MLAVLIVLGAGAAGLQVYLARRTTGRRTLSRPARTGTAVTAVIVALFAGLVIYAATDTGSKQALTGANPARLGSLQTNRYAYWRVAIADGFANHPLNGVGAGGFAATWLRYRTIPERVRVPHSLYVETLAELGLVGFALLIAFFGGIGCGGATRVPDHSRRGPPARSPRSSPSPRTPPSTGTGRCRP